MDWSIPSATSASGSSTEPSVSPWKYDVFLSFRGEDTRKGVVSHLYDELQNRSGIGTFMDDIRLEVGAPISTSLLKAIEESRFAIVVLSPNHASSAWCSDELKHIKRIVEDMRRKVVQIPHIAEFEPSVSTRLHVPDEISEEVEKKHISVGPYGSDKEWVHFDDDGVHSAVRQLVIHFFKHFTLILCIQTEYVCGDGNSFWSNRHGRPRFGAEKETLEVHNT